MMPTKTSVGPNEVVRLEAIQPIPAPHSSLDPGGERWPMLPLLAPLITAQRAAGQGQVPWLLVI
jgi:hypothetical protein